MTKRLTAVLVVLGVGALGAGLSMRDCRSSDEADVPGDIGAAPDFYVSSPRLLEPKSQSIELRADSEGGTTTGVPYFIAFSDGEYVWGYTSEEEGKTRTVYSDATFEAYWYGDAEQQWLQRHPNGRATK